MINTGGEIFPVPVPDPVPDPVPVPDPDPDPDPVPLPIINPHLPYPIVKLSESKW